MNTENSPTANDFLTMLMGKVQARKGWDGSPEFGLMANNQGIIQGSAFPIGEISRTSPGGPKWTVESLKRATISPEKDYEKNFVREMQNGFTKGKLKGLYLIHDGWTLPGEDLKKRAKRIKCGRGAPDICYYGARIRCRFAHAVDATGRSYYVSYAEGAKGVDVSVDDAGEIMGGEYIGILRDIVNVSTGHRGAPVNIPAAP